MLFVLLFVVIYLDDVNEKFGFFDLWRVFVVGKVLDNESDMESIEVVYMLNGDCYMVMGW